MTALPPDDADSPNRERSAAEVDAEFAAIIAGIAAEMTWTTGNESDSAANPAAAAAPATPPAVPDPAPTDQLRQPAVDDRDGSAAAAERERRRALRRALRAEEVALFAASQAESAAELQADEAHFVPPEPPPVPRPKRRTVVALLFIAAGLGLLIWPDLVQVSPQAVLVLAITFLVGGFAMLVYGLRPQASDPEADGWDDGARL